MSRNGCPGARLNGGMPGRLRTPCCLRRRPLAVNCSSRLMLLMAMRRTSKPAFFAGLSLIFFQLRLMMLRSNVVNDLTVIIGSPHPRAGDAPQHVEVLGRDFDATRLLPPRLAIGVPIQQRLGLDLLLAEHVVNQAAQVVRHPGNQRRPVPSIEHAHVVQQEQLPQRQAHRLREAQPAETDDGEEFVPGAVFSRSNAASVSSSTSRSIAVVSSSSLASSFARIVSSARRLCFANVDKAVPFSWKKSSRLPHRASFSARSVAPSIASQNCSSVMPAASACGLTTAQ